MSDIIYSVNTLYIRNTGTCWDKWTLQRVPQKINQMWKDCFVCIQWNKDILEDNIQCTDHRSETKLCFIHWQLSAWIILCKQKMASSDLGSIYSLVNISTLLNTFPDSRVTYQSNISVTNTLFKTHISPFLLGNDGSQLDLNSGLYLGTRKVSLWYSPSKSGSGKYYNWWKYVICFSQTSQN